MELKIINKNEDQSKKIYKSNDCQQLINSMNEYYAKIGFHLPWVGYFVLTKDRIAGTCGFTGPPNEGVVEIAYWTFKEYEGKGIASYACSQLVKIAKTTDPTVRITAKTAPEHNASTFILKKNDFHLHAIVQDEEIGDAWLWELSTD